MSVPEFFLSTVIPEPSYEFMTAETQILALFNVGDTVLQFYWWRERRQVIVYTQTHRLWLLQNDLRIRESIADLMIWPEFWIEADNMVLFDGPEFRHGFAMPDALEQVFLDCEWSDYACDWRPVSGTITKKVFVPTPPAKTHAFPRVSRWSRDESLRGDDETLCGAKELLRSDDDETSLSDDDAPPSPRKWLRFQTWE